MPTTYEHELEVEHRWKNRKNELVLMKAKRVDDIEVTGEPAKVKPPMDELERVFGKLTTTE